MQAKSFASFDSVENEVRTMALAASSTTEMSRVQSTSSVIASNVGMNRPLTLALSPGGGEGIQSKHDVAGGGDARGGAGADDERRALLFDDGGALDFVADTEAVAVVDRRLGEAARFAEVRGAPALERGGRARAPSALEHHLAARHGRARRDADVQEFHGDSGRRQRELLPIRRLERLRQPPAARGAVKIRPLGQLDDQVEALAQKP